MRISWRSWLVSRMNELGEAWDQMEATTSTAVREAAFQLTAVPGQSHRVLTVAKPARRVACSWIPHPATLVTTALNDDRAPAWQAMRFAAALQAAQACGRPVLLRAETTGGHGGNDFVEEAADALAFAAQQLGMTIPSVDGR